MTSSTSPHPENLVCNYSIILFDLEPWVGDCSTSTQLSWLNPLSKYHPGVDVTASIVTCVDYSSLSPLPLPLPIAPVYLTCKYSSYWWSSRCFHVWNHSCSTNSQQATASAQPMRDHCCYSGRCFIRFLCSVCLDELGIWFQDGLNHLPAV
jgi:hypothetical protein